MKNAKPVNPFAPIEVRKFTSPVSLASILVLAGMVLEIYYSASPVSIYLIAFGAIGIIYIILANIFFVRLADTKIIHSAINSLIIGVGLGSMSILLPDELREVNHILVIFGTMAIATTSGRRYALQFLIGVLIVILPNNYFTLTSISEVLEYFTPFAISIVILEVLMQLKNTARQHINGLETINKVSRQIMQTLDTKQTLSLLDATIQDTLEADTFFIGILQGDDISFELFYDDGEYYNEVSVPMKGTLSGWVIDNQKELFLPDLREEVHIDGLESIVIGKEKTSLSWIGVPLKSVNVTGILAMASYTANAFDSADLELLVNLGQHVTLALDNTIRHAQVEKQARLDSLTGVYNHGYFLENLAKQADYASGTNTPLSLIMLDIDYFKQYNDTYGHLVGDRVLQGLCAAIQQHIKQTDSVGRWGGEEFVISLPGANGEQAAQIAKRISETLKDLQVRDQDQQTIPIPTISQGIAVYPQDADEIYRLIDTADKRLYVAKKRGRNQIEPVTYSENT